MDPVRTHQADHQQGQQKLRVVGGRDYSGHDEDSGYDGAGRREERNRPAPVSTLAAGDRPSASRQTDFGEAVRQVVAEAAPDEDGIVSISLAEIMERAREKIRAAAAVSSANS